MKQRKIYKKITAFTLCVIMVLMSNMSVFALTEGSCASNLLYNGATTFMIDGTLYECPQTKYTFRLEYNKINDVYYNLDTCSMIRKSTSGNARGFKVCATTGKGSGTLSIYRNNPYTSAAAAARYTGSGDIVCSFTASAGFPLGSATNKTSGTSSYCEVLDAYTYNGRSIVDGTVKCYKANCSGTVTTKVDLF